MGFGAEVAARVARNWTYERSYGPVYGSTISSVRPTKRAGDPTELGPPFSGGRAEGSRELTVMADYLPSSGARRMAGSASTVDQCGHRRDLQRNQDTSAIAPYEPMA